MDKILLLRKTRRPDELIRHRPRVAINNFLEAELRNNFLITVEGDSMIGAGIYSGDLLLVDTNIIPKDGNIVVAEINSCLVVKRLQYDDNFVILLSENPNYDPIVVHENDSFYIKGVVRNVIREMP